MAVTTRRRCAKELEPKRTPSLKFFEDPRHILKLLIITMDDTLHIHGNHDSGQSDGKVIDQLCPVLSLDALRKPGCHPVEVYPDLQLHGGKGDTGPLLDFYHHS